MWFVTVIRLSSKRLDLFDQNVDFMKKRMDSLQYIDFIITYIKLFYSYWTIKASTTMVIGYMLHLHIIYIFFFYNL